MGKRLRFAARWRKLSFYRAAEVVDHFLHQQIHVLVVIVGLFLTCYTYLRTALAHTVWPRPEISWEEIVGVATILCGVALKKALALNLRRNDTVLMRRGAGDPAIQSCLIRNEADLDRFIALIEAVYPSHHVSSSPAEARARVYRNWAAVCPGFARLLLLTQPDGTVVDIGFTLILRTDRRTYVNYRNGESDPWTWDPEHFRTREAFGTPYLFLQAAYCRNVPNVEAGASLYHHLLEHINSFCRHTSGQPPVL